MRLISQFSLVITTEITDTLAPWRRAFLDKPTVSQIVKKFLAFYGTRILNTMLQNSDHLSLPTPKPMQSTSSYLISLRLIPIVSSYLHLGHPSRSSKYIKIIISPSYFYHGALLTSNLSPFNKKYQAPTQAAFLLHELQCLQIY